MDAKGPHIPESVSQIFSRLVSLLLFHRVSRALCHPLFPLTRSFKLVSSLGMPGLRLCGVRPPRADGEALGVGWGAALPWGCQQASVTRGPFLSGLASSRKPPWTAIGRRSLRELRGETDRASEGQAPGSHSIFYFQSGLPPLLSCGLVSPSPESLRFSLSRRHPSASSAPVRRGLGCSLESSNHFCFYSVITCADTLRGTRCPQTGAFLGSAAQTIVSVASVCPLPIA